MTTEGIMTIEDCRLTIPKPKSAPFEQQNLATDEIPPFTTTATQANVDVLVTPSISSPAVEYEERFNGGLWGKQKSSSSNSSNDSGHPDVSSSSSGWSVRPVKGEEVQEDTVRKQCLVRPVITPPPPATLRSRLRQKVSGCLFTNYGVCSIQTSLFYMWSLL
ncbi:hypothetical protein CEXT_44301 [Caerostris extrusa]|uniref:Uncharacterized protein n=1 Tax=Caerostris extrusa TaxID=172846 RepID=A0AAV4QCD0_CAEEX|nr:hypothetical protein CEXT_44301 [Caerostris extrusa]